MSAVCFVTPRLFPVQSADDWALEVWWRSCELALTEAEVCVFWIVPAGLRREFLGRARKQYAAHNITLVVKEDLVPFLAPDENPKTTGSELAALLVLPALSKLHRERRFSRIELPADRGLALRTVQAQRTGLDFTDTDLVVVLGRTGEWRRYDQRRLSLKPADIRHDFAERESIELAQSAVTSDPALIRFASEIGWQTDHIGVRSLPVHQPKHLPDVIRAEAPCYFGNPDEDPGFEHFRLLVEKSTRFERWLSCALDQSEAAGRKRVSALEQAAQTRGVQLEILANFDWEGLPGLLRSHHAFVLLMSPLADARLLWLLRESVPFVFPLELLETIPLPQRESARALSFALDNPNSLHSALQNASAFTSWTSLFAAWRQELMRSAGLNPRPASRPAPAPQPPPARMPRVTIAVSHFNLKHLLAETLECLETQTYAGCDVVVADDGSDDPESIAAWNECRRRFPGFQFIELPHSGYWSPRNHVIFNSRNPYVIIVDGDNLPKPEMTECLVAAMERNPEFASFTSYIAAFREHGAAARRNEFEALNTPVGGDIVSGYFQNIFGDTNSIFRTEVLQAIGGFREDFPCAFGDWELFQRLTGKGHRLGVVPKVLLHYRRRAGGMIRQRSLYLEHWQFLPVLELPEQIRPADLRRLNFALHGLALDR